MSKIVKVLTVTVALLLFMSGLSQAQLTEYEMLFTCDMAVQIFFGNFDPNQANDKLWVRGSFNGWGTTDQMSPSAIDSSYTAVVFDSLVPVQDTAAYKFYYEHDDAGNIAQVWESGSDRLFWATGNETDLNGNGIPDLIIPRRYFNDIGFGDVFIDSADIVFEVHMRPAHLFLADSGAITFGGGNVTDVDSVFFNGGAPGTTPELLWTWDNTSDPRIYDLMMHDDGMDGDMVAGDSIYSLAIKFHPGASKVLTWKHGIRPIDNEAAFQEDHQQNVDTPNGRVFKWFGENTVGGSGWYEPYIPSTGIEDGENNIVPQTHRLDQNYPNPFNPQTTIPFALAHSASVTIEVYNVLGEKVRTVVDERFQPGVHTIVWDAKDNHGQQVGSGVYFYRFQANDIVKTKKMILMR